MDNDIINLQNRIVHLESEVMWLKNEIKEIMKDIIHSEVFTTRKELADLYKICDPHDDLG